WIDMKPQLSFLTGQRLGRDRLEIDLKILGLLLRIIPGEFGTRCSGGRCAWHDKGVRNQLRRCPIRIEVSQDAVCSRLRKDNVVVKPILDVVPGRMIVHKELKVIADKERMKEFFMDNLKVRHRQILPRIEYLESD